LDGVGVGSGLGGSLSGGGSGLTVRDITHAFIDGVWRAQQQAAFGCRIIACPSIRTLAEKASLGRQLERIWRESEMLHVEIQAYVLQRANGALYLGAKTYGREGEVTDIPEPPANAVADFHTHPSVGLNYSIDGGWPTTQDFSHAQDRALHMIVYSRDWIYYRSYDGKTYFKLRH
jgi:hypothetical protein